MSSSNFLVSADAQNLLTRARHYASVGDRWLVSVGRAFVRSADRLGTEASVVASSAEKAANTTLNVSRGLMGVLSNKVVTVRIRRTRGAGGAGAKPTGEHEVAQLVDQVAAVAKAHASTIASLPYAQFDTLVHGLCARLQEDLGALVGDATASGEAAAPHPAVMGAESASEPPVVEAVVQEAAPPVEAEEGASKHDALAPPAASRKRGRGASKTAEPAAAVDAGAGEDAGGNGGPPPEEPVRTDEE